MTDQPPSWDNPSVLKAIEEERAEYERRKVPTSPLEGQAAPPLDSWADFPERPMGGASGSGGEMIELDVCVAGTPMKRKFQAGPAYLPP